MIVPDMGELGVQYGYLPGIYFYKAEEKYLSSLTINEYTGFGTIKLLDNKYLNCDQSFDTTSNNPIANKVVSEEVAKINTAIEDIQKSAVGKNVEGTSQNVDGTSITAGSNAEIFNNYTGNRAVGEYSHAEGNITRAVGNASHAEGTATTATGDHSHAEGYDTTASNVYSHAEGAGTTASGITSHAEGADTTASGAYSHPEGSGTKASGVTSHAEGQGTIAEGSSSHAEGKNTIATGPGAHAEGYNYTYPIKVTGVANSTTYTLSENVKNKYIRLGARIIYNNVISAISSYNPDTLTITVTPSLSDEDLNEQSVTLYFGAFGTAAHAEGYETIASANQSHAEGSETTASGTSSHAEGTNTIASASESHAEGSHTKASGAHSHAEGEYTIAAGFNQHVQGKYNIQNSSLAHIVGNGTAEDACSNAHTLDWNGDAWYAGDVYVGSTSGTNKDDGSKKLATEARVTELINETLGVIENGSY